MSPDSIGDVGAMVRRTQRVLIAVSIGSALLWAVGGATVIAALATRATGIGAAFVIGTFLMWRDRAVWSVERVALWIEEHRPGLDFALVTAVDPAATTIPDHQVVSTLLSRAVTAAGVEPRHLWLRAAQRRIGAAVAGLIVSALLVAAIARYPVRRALERLTTAPLTHERHNVDRLARIAASVIPPAYSHFTRQEVVDPSEISALVGSQIIVHGHGATQGLGATVGSATRDVGPAADGWEVVVPMPAAPTLLQLSEQASYSATGVRPPPRHRLVTLIPTVDAPPSVELLAPERDSVMRRATGTLALRARATDDIGLAAGHFEIVLTTGDEDAGGVHARTLAVASRSLGDARAGELQGSLRLDSLQLAPGSVLSIRAIARDGNTMSGPGIGTSDTRTFRIAQRDEYDSVAIESATPNVADSSALSERVVIIGTTALIARVGRQPPITRDSMARASQRLADQQDAVRNAITAVMSADDENELPMADVLSAPERALLDSAAYAMGEAAARLAARTPQTALPAERRALALVDSARSLARRVYLRSRPPRLLVDVAHVRMSGTEHPDPAARSPGRPDTADAHWLARLSDVARVLASSGQRGTGAFGEARRAAIDSLVVLRVAVLGSRPMLAAALTQAIDTMRVGGDPMPALARARTFLADPVTTTAGLPPGRGGR